MESGAESVGAEAGGNCEVEGGWRALVPTGNVDIGGSTGGRVNSFDTIFGEGSLERPWL